MNKKIQLLDCTLRDGAYIVDGKFGVPVMRGIMKKLQDSNVDIIECGWLKDAPHVEGTSFFHSPPDLDRYLPSKMMGTTYVAMIDWDRYDISRLPTCNGETLDAIRIVFPYGKHREGIAIGQKIVKKGYKVFYQAANTLAYSGRDLIELARDINKAAPVALSIVDTMRFVELLNQTDRECIVDASLCGMGRGAGNATTELVANYLNRQQHCNYDMNQIMDAIDMYMPYFQENFVWGYSTPYLIAGMYCCHVNNITYLLKNHRTSARDMKNIIESLSPDDRKKYNYDLLEEKYIENQNRIVDDEKVLEQLRAEFRNREVLLIAPGKSVETEAEAVHAYIREKAPVVIGVNAIIPAYTYDYLFVMNVVRYDYAKEAYAQKFDAAKKILLSNVKTEAYEREIIVNFNRVIKRGWEHFDNAVINLLRLLDKLHVCDVAIAGFDGFKHKYNESYADISLPTLNPDNKWDALNDEIDDMFQDFKASMQMNMNIKFVTDSIFNR